MAVDGGSPALAIRSSVGIELWASSGPKLPYEHKSNLPREETKNSRSITFSPDGRYFAFSNGHEVRILSTSNWQEKCTLPRPKAFYLKFSPRGNYLCTWELYVVNKEKPEGSPNMFVYELETGNEVFSIVQKTQTDWEPSWSTDEAIFALVVGGEALFYDLSDGIAGFKSTTRRIGGSRGGALSLGPGNSPPFLAFYIPGAKGAPSMCRLYKYPALAQNQTVACKSFFQADRVEILWNIRGTGLLLLTSTEVDKSGASYYGNQALHFMATKGDSCAVSLSKEGPVHCVKWSPKAKEFVVVYGYMPSKAALYNLKCDVVFDFGEGPRNCAYFNPFGNLLVLAGFGNLPGNVEIWDVSKREKLASIKCPDTTYFEWNPNGEYFVTATTAPRLRIGNGFKVYHYSGALMHETMWPQGQELLGIEWQKYDEKSFAEPIITKAKQEGIKSSQPEASKKAYTPPHLRLMKEGKNPEKYLPQPKANMPGMPMAAATAGNAGGQGNGNNNSNHNNWNNRKSNNKQNAKAYKTKQNKKENGTINDALAAAGAGVGGVGVGVGGVGTINEMSNEIVAGTGGVGVSGSVIGIAAQGGNANGGDAPSTIVFVRNGTEHVQQAQYRQQQSSQLQQQQQQQQRTMPPRKQQTTTHKKPYQQQHPQQNYQHRSQQQQGQQQQQPLQAQQNVNAYFDSSGDVSKVSSKQSFSSDQQPAHFQQQQQQQQQQQPQQQQQQQQQHQQQQQPQQQQQQQPQQQQQQQQPQQQQNSKRTPTSDKEKKIRNIAKKLSDIKKLKLRQEQGETLELNQLHKIDMEEKFLKELRALKLTE